MATGHKTKPRKRACREPDLAIALAGFASKQDRHAKKAREL